MIDIELLWYSTKLALGKIRCLSFVISNTGRIMPNQQFQTIFALKTRFKNPTLALQILCLVGWRNTLEIASAMSRLLDYCLIPSALSTSRAITVAKGGLISEDNRGATTGKVLA